MHIHQANNCPCRYAGRIEVDAGRKLIVKQKGEDAKPVKFGKANSEAGKLNHAGKKG